MTKEWLPMPVSFELPKIGWYWERQDSNLRRKPPTDLQSVALNHSATLPFPPPPQYVPEEEEIRFSMELCTYLLGLIFYP